jgi:hypothetical protein
MPRPFSPRGSHAGMPTAFPRAQEKTASSRVGTDHGATRSCVMHAKSAPFGVHILRPQEKRAVPRRCARRIVSRRPFLLRPLSTQAPHGSLADRRWPPPLSRSSWVYVLRVASFRPVTCRPSMLLNLANSQHPEKPAGLRGRQAASSCRCSLGRVVRARPQAYAIRHIPAPVCRVLVSSVSVESERERRCAEAWKGQKSEVEH